MGHRIEPSDQSISQLAQNILLAIEGIRYGSVEIIIHDSQIVQIERREKLRVKQTDEDLDPMG
jgi:hypothetical protein